MSGPPRSQSAESFDLVSIGSDDHIVWPKSAAAAAYPAGRPWADDCSESGDVGTDDDFIVLRASPRRGAPRSEEPRSTTHVETGDELAPALEGLTLGTQAPVTTAPSTPVVQPAPKAPSAGSKHGKASTRSAPAPSAGTSTAKAQAAAPPVQVPASKRKRAKARRKAKAETASAGAKQPSAAAGNIIFSAYEEAVRYITTCLSDTTKAKKDKSSQLTFLQALIIELGLYSPLSKSLDTKHSHTSQLPSPPHTPAPAAGAAPPAPRISPLAALPRTINSARAAIKSRVFLNVLDYLAVRGDCASGPAPLQALMHPSRSALARALRSGKSAVANATTPTTGSKHRKRPIPIAKVKRSGLDVLLVSCYYR